MDLFLHHRRNSHRYRRRSRGRAHETTTGLIAPLRCTTSSQIPPTSLLETGNPSLSPTLQGILPARLGYFWCSVRTRFLIMIHSQWPFFELVVMARNAKPVCFLPPAVSSSPRELGDRFTARSEGERWKSKIPFVESQNREFRLSLFFSSTTRLFASFSRPRVHDESVAKSKGRAMVRNSKATASGSGATNRGGEATRGATPERVLGNGSRAETTNHANSPSAAPAVHRATRSRSRPPVVVAAATRAAAVESTRQESEELEDELELTGFGTAVRATVTTNVFKSTLRDSGQ